MPKLSWEVRRRRFGDRRWLVRHNDFYEIDPVTDSVWLACAEGMRVEDIVRRVAEQHGLRADEALTRTALALRTFAQAGLLELGEA